MVRERIERLRNKMIEKGIDAYIIPTSDPHQSEYVEKFYKTREYISGFTGSAGTVVVTRNKAGLWTDGRYFIQAANELKGSGIDLYKVGLDDTVSIYEFLNRELKDNEVVGFNGETYSYSDYLQLEKNIKGKKINFKEELVESIWNDRPESSKNEVFLHEEKYTGVSAKEKISLIRKEMIEKKIDNYLISSLDDIAYILNIRGSDVEYTPVVVSHLLIGKEKVNLFIDLEKVNEDIKANLNGQGVELVEYGKVFDFVKGLDSTENVYLNKDKINVKLFMSLPENINKEFGDDISTIMKAVKNDIEIENQRNAYIKDGVALVKFLNWLESNIGINEITEMSASEKLLNFRKEQKLFVEPSFNTISAYGENAALPHYSPSDDSPVKLQAKGLYLVDSGGQYLDGTTDITRTIALGDLTKDEVEHYTYTLKSHIALITAIFKKGTKSSTLDIIARMPLWQKGIDFNHGTGHGVGYFLGCHEGPQRIAPVQNDYDMVPGMITSNEPGIYIEGSHGIRIENIMICTEKMTTDFGVFFGFESLSLCPIDTKPVNKELLTGEEKKWLNEYHKTCYEKLSPYLQGEELDYLINATREI